MKLTLDDIKYLVKESVNKILKEQHESRSNKRVIKEFNHLLYGQDENDSYDEGSATIDHYDLISLIPDNSPFYDLDEDIVEREFSKLAKEYYVTVVGDEITSDSGLLEDIEKIDNDVVSDALYTAYYKIPNASFLKWTEIW